MLGRSSSLAIAAFICGGVAATSCANDTEAAFPGTGGGNSASGGATGSGSGGTTSGSGGASSGGATGSASGGTTASGGQMGAASGGTTGSGGGTAGGASSGGASTGGASGRMGSGGGAMAGRTGAGGHAGTAGTGDAATGSGGATTGAGGAISATLDCGSMAQVIESHGPPKNRINYIIVGDGYSETEVKTTLITHVQNYMTRRFSEPIGVPYKRYRNFFNICVLQVPSTPICGTSAFSCCGDDQSRLANCDDTKVNAAIKKYIPSAIPVDFKAVVLNGTRWWNSGGMLMYWSGNSGADAPGAALHEGSHGFHQLADEYGDCTGAQCGKNTDFTGTAGTVYPEVNSCGDPTTTDDKWLMWKGYNAADSTGMVGTWSGSRYVGTGQYRPSANSCMNSLFGNDKNTSFNPVSREQIAVGMYRYVKPIDSTVPAAGAVTNPGVLTVNVIDAAVINVDWTVDGTTKINAGTTFDTSTLAPGSHTLIAKAYDNAGDDLVRTKTCPSSVTGYYCHAKNWANSVQTVEWTVTRNSGP